MADPRAGTDRANGDPADADHAVRGGGAPQARADRAGDLAFGPETGAWHFRGCGGGAVFRPGPDRPWRSGPATGNARGGYILPDGGTLPGRCRCRGGACGGVDPDVGHCLAHHIVVPALTGWKRAIPSRRFSTYAAAT